MCVVPYVERAEDASPARRNCISSVPHEPRIVNPKLLGIRCCSRYCGWCLIVNALLWTLGIMGAVGFVGLIVLAGVR